jgi:2-methylisocitrate lyase-like PEP mutase family enzyme
LPPGDAYARSLPACAAVVLVQAPGALQEEQLDDQHPRPADGLLPEATLAAWPPSCLSRTQVATEPATQPPDDPFPMIDAASKLRDIIAAPGVVVVPGVHDAMTARMAEQAGFPLVDVESAGSLAVAHGLSDHGIGNVSDLLGHARDVALAIGVPAFADLDDGGGTPLTVARAITVAAGVGIAGVHIDDIDGGRKAFPGYPDVLIEDARAADRVRAAVDARGDDPLVIVARSYAPNPGQAIDRLSTFAQLGADVLFPVRLGYAAVIELSDRLPQPLYCADSRNMAPPSELVTAGVKFVMDNDVFQISARVVKDLLAELRREGFIAGADSRALSWDEFHEVMGTREATAQAIKYGML